MPQAARSYRDNAQRAPRYDGLRVLTNDDRAVPRQDIDPSFGRLVKGVIIALMVLAVIGIARVAVTAANADLQTQNASKLADVNTLRTEGTLLESEQAELYAPDRISSVAEDKLGMTERVSGDYLYLTDDIVATDSKGDISIAGTFSAYVSGDDAAGSDGEMDLLSGD